MGKGKAIIIFLVISIIFCVVSFNVIREVNAHFTSRNINMKQAEMQDIDIEINFNDIEIVEDSESNIIKYIKKITIKNIGGNDALVRFNVIPTWYKENGDSSVGDISFIKYNISGLNENIKKDNDEYYYLGKSLGVDESIILEILYYVDIPSKFIDIYNDKNVEIDLWIEAVQCTKDAHRSVWSTSSEEVKVMLDSLCEF